MTDYQRGLQSNIWKYGVFLITGRRIFWPILTVYFLTLPDATIRQIGFFMAIGQIANVLTEVPSGYVADKIGHKKALIIAKISLIISTVLFLVGQHFIFFALGSVFFSVAIAFRSGTLTAFMQETLLALGRQKEYSKLLGRVKSITWIISAALLAVIPALAGINFRLPLLAGLVFDILGLLVVLSFVEPQRTFVETEEVKIGNFRTALAEARRLNFIPVIVFTGLLGAVLLGVGTLRDVYQQFLGIPIVYLGLLFALSRLMASAVSALVYRLKQFLTIGQYFLAEIIFFMPLIFLIGFLENKWAVAVLFIIVVGYHFGESVLSAHYQLEYIEQSRFKATLLSLGNLLASLGFAGTGLLLGFLADRYLYGIGYMAYAVISLVLLLAAYIYFLRYGQKKSV